MPSGENGEVQYVLLVTPQEPPPPPIAKEVGVVDMGGGMIALKVKIRKYPFVLWQDETIGKLRPLYQR